MDPKSNQDVMAREPASAVPTNIDQHAKYNQLAVIAFILSFPFFVPIAGLIMGIIALVQLRKQPQKGTGLAYAAVVIAIPSTILGGLAIAWAFHIHI